MFSFLKRLLATPSQKATPQSFSAQEAAFLTSMLDHETKALDTHEKAQADPGPRVRLTPVVPFPDAPTGSWFGGAPHLPETTDWPEIDGTQLLFLAQIDLAQLPVNIWSGLGPREGHLAFFVHPESAGVAVLHVQGDLVRREGPCPRGSRWEWDSDSDDRPAVWPEWPVYAEGQTGPVCYPTAPRPGELITNGFSTPVLDLSNPAHHPVTSGTLAILIKGALDEATKRVEKTERFLGMRPWPSPNRKLVQLTDADRQSLETLLADLQSTRADLIGVAEALSQGQTGFDNPTLPEQLSALADLPFGDFTYLRDNVEGLAELEITPKSLSDPNRKADVWGCAYLEAQERHAKALYLEGRLPDAQRAHNETVWAHDAQLGCGDMSHAPRGFFYTPHGPDSGNEVLLELHPSRLIGWNMAHYSLVFVIPRGDLAKGRFDRVISDVTNG